MRWQALNDKRRRTRQNVSAFKGLDATGEFTMPANANLFVSQVDASADIVEALTVAGVAISVPAAGAAHVHSVGWFERGAKVEVLAPFSLMIDAGLGRYVKIASAGEG